MGYITKKKKLGNVGIGVEAKKWLEALNDTSVFCAISLLQIGICIFGKGSLKALISFVEDISQISHVNVDSKEQRS